jgi:hypothetical protein
MFPFAIWAGIHFRELVGMRLGARQPGEEKATPVVAAAPPRAVRRRKKR